MKKVFGFILQQKRAVLFIFLLLIVQAICELALPQYTSDIVDIGILSNGIESVVPNVIRESTLNSVEAFLFDEDLHTIQQGYEIIDYEKLSKDEQKKYKKKYPTIVSENLYEWVGTKEDVEKVELPFSKVVILLTGMAKEGADVSKLTMMDENQRKQVAAGLDEKLAEVDESLIPSMANGFVAKEYDAIGINLEELQNHFILFTGLKMLGISFVAVLATIVVSYLAAKAGGRIGRDLRNRIFKKVVYFSNAELDEFSTASLITRSTNDVQQIQMISILLLRMVFYAPILGIGGIIKVMSTNTSMGWIIGVAVAIISVIVIGLFAIVIPKFRLIQTLVDKVNLVTREILTGIPVIRAFSTERYEEKRFDKANKDLTSTMLFTSRVMTLMMPTMMLLINGISLAIVWFSAKKIDAGTLQVGEMIAFITYAMQIVMSFLMITMISLFLPRAGVAAGRIDEVLKTEPTLKDPAKPAAINQYTKGVIEFKDVSFKYPGADGYTLEHISFTAKPGETTAIIGSTGSGKSTLVNLIPRFYDVTDGSVCIDHVDVRSITQSELRKRLGYVPQKAVLFTGTIASNIAYGNEEVSEKEIQQAASIAQSTEFIESKEDKYNSPISQSGTNVSGGQKQRIAIARAVARNPEIFVFDDSFSALDYKTDVALRKALREQTSESTVLVVAQRISTIIHADQIIVLDEGKIVGKGTHEELLKNCKVYYEIASSQLSASELEAYGIN
ncbi:MAG: ABC transporter ATP-binding protein [Clostridium sp.]|nr:ABC transporter ATP-binding protein [Clostridium sp.]